MPTIYKVRDQIKRTSQFYGSYPQVRKIVSENPDAGLMVEPLEYQYKWQLVVMLKNAYDEGRDDVLNGVD